MNDPYYPSLPNTDGTFGGPMDRGRGHHQSHLHGSRRSTSYPRSEEYGRDLYGGYDARRAAAVREWDSVDLYNDSGGARGQYGGYQGESS